MNLDLDPDFYLDLDLDLDLDQDLDLDVVMGWYTQRYLQTSYDHNSGMGDLLLSTGGVSFFFYFCKSR